MTRLRPKINSIEEAEALLRKGYFTNDESFRISKQINIDSDRIKETQELINDTPVKKKWWQFWK